MAENGNSLETTEANLISKHLWMFLKQISVLGLITEHLSSSWNSVMWSKGSCSSMVTETLIFWQDEFNVCLVCRDQIVLVYLLYLLYTLTNTIGFDLEENITVQDQRNQKTSSCSIQYPWDIEKLRTVPVPVLCSCCCMHMLSWYGESFNVPGLL